jgi:polysaccharide export outer membrane protein
MFPRTFLLLLGCVTAVCQPKLADRNPPYRLQAGDTIEVQYRLTPEYNGAAIIQPGGLASLPLIGDVNLAGLTVEEAHKAILTVASDRLNQPEVTVLLKDYVRPYFVVAGEVGHPGRFDMRGDITALQAIAMAGGFKDSSKHSQVLLIRKFNAETAEVKSIDMKAMARKGKALEDPSLKPGDILLVPQNVVSKLERYVRWSNVGLWGLSLGL